MKGYLIIDMPQHCCECPVSCDGYTPSESKKMGKEKPSWCPLKQLPPKKHSSELVEDEWGEYIKESDFARGFNLCLDMIAGETERDAYDASVRKDEVEKNDDRKMAIETRCHESQI